RFFHFFSHTFNSSFRKSFFKTLIFKTLIVAKNLMAFSFGLQLNLSPPFYSPSPIPLNPSIMVSSSFTV
ncbi:MAG: hypothetical protein EBZ49_16315, partial [Proteobacteria bacterium]|nr:hypothetical protein [Pseudomonadota bacterium]